MTARRILVTSANGRTGRAVVRALTTRGHQVRAFIRNADQWPALQADTGAVEYAVGDLLNPASLQAALVDCEAVVHIGPPMHPDEVAMTRDCLAAARANKLTHFIYYSVMHPLRRDVRHHRLKLDAEQAVVESGLRYTILQPMRYMQHLEPLWKQVCEQGIHSMPFNIDVKFSVVDLEDLAAAVAVVAGSEAYSYATYELAGPQALSQRDMADILTTALGTQVRAEALPLATLRARAQAAGASADRVEQMVSMNHHYDQHGFPGNPLVLQMLLGRPATRYEQYVQRLLARTRPGARPGVRP